VRLHSLPAGAGRQALLAQTQIPHLKRQSRQMRRTQMHPRGIYAWSALQPSIRSQPRSGTPDVTNSSRRQKKSEFDKCTDNGVDGVIEVKIGFDGIVMANAIDAAPINMGLKDVYMAFAKQVPTSDTDCTLRANPFTKWSEINPSLPDTTIEAYGPPPTSGTRDAFVEIAMEGGAKKVTCLAGLRKSDKKAFKTISHDKIKGASMDGAEPTFENISSGLYPVSRSLFFYLKKDHIGQTPGLQEFALEFTSDQAWGEGGYLEEIGLVPLPRAEQVKYRTAVENLVGYSQ